MDATIQLTSLGSSLFLLLICLTPLGLAIALLHAQLRPLITQLAPWAALPALLLAYGTEIGGIQDFHWALLGMQLGLDNVGQVFLGFSALIWWLGGFLALHLLRETPRRPEFMGFYLLSMSGNLGVILAQEVSSFYFFYALMSFAAYGLVIYTRSVETIRAGWIYLSFVVVGEMCLLVAILASVYVAGGANEFSAIQQAIIHSEYQHLIILMVLLAFGSKVGLLGLHFSLPIAYQAIPVAGAVVLGGAMLNAGLLGWLRFLPIGEVELHSWGHGFIVLGLLAAFYAALVGTLQTQFKALLAYSSISQMGIMTVILGYALQNPTSALILPLLLAYALHHALAKTALFFGAGMITAVKTHTWRWIMLILLLIPALSIAGLPYTSGMAVKATLKTVVTDSPNDWQTLLPTLLTLSSLATTLLLGRYFWLLRPQQIAESTSPKMGLPVSVWGAWWVLLIVIVSVTLQLNTEYASILAKKNMLWEGLPIWIGLALIGISLYLARQWTLWHIPAGDIFWWAWQAVPQWNRICCDQFCQFTAKLPREVPAYAHLQARFAQLLALEAHLLTWQVAGLVLLSLLIGLISMMMI